MDIALLLVVNCKYDIIIDRTMASLSYGSVFCLESQKIDGTEYLRGRPTLRFFLYY